MKTEVILCKDCEYSEISAIGCLICTRPLGYKGNGTKISVMVDADDYCSRAVVEKSKEKNVEWLIKIN